MTRGQQEETPQCQGEEDTYENKQNFSKIAPSISWWDATRAVFFSIANNTQDWLTCHHGVSEIRVVGASKRSYFNSICHCVLHCYVCRPTYCSYLWNSLLGTSFTNMLRELQPPWITWGKSTPVRVLRCSSREKQRNFPFRWNKTWQRPRSAQNSIRSCNVLMCVGVFFLSTSHDTCRSIYLLFVCMNDKHCLITHTYPLTDAIDTIHAIMPPSGRQFWAKSPTNCTLKSLESQTNLLKTFSSFASSYLT